MTAPPAAPAPGAGTSPPRSEPAVAPQAPPDPEPSAPAPSGDRETGPAQDELTIEGVPALVSRERLAPPALAATSGDGPRLVQIAQVRGEERRDGVDVEVPLDAERPIEQPEPAPVATARPQLPLSGFDVAWLAALGFAMVLTGLTVRRAASPRAV